MATRMTSLTSAGAATSSCSPPAGTRPSCCGTFTAMPPSRPSGTALCRELPCCLCPCCSHCTSRCRHDDSVMAVAFHPVDSRHFVSCSWNGKVRLQCANPARVVDWKQVQLHDALPIHCVRFNSRGSCVTVGALQGRVRHFKVPPSLKLEYHADIGASLPPSIPPPSPVSSHPCAARRCAGEAGEAA